MVKVRSSWYHFLVVIGLISIIQAQDEKPTTSTFETVLLSETELKYLNERLQTKDHLSRDDAINAILELEHFYTLLKTDGKGLYSPSAMVDLAWHQHILHTEMYSNFSRQHFNVDFVHHLPFWSGNMDIVEKADKENPRKTGAKATYEALVELFGVDQVNATVWLGNRSEHDTDKSEMPKENIEL